MIDLRSDTVTKPTNEMRDKIRDAKVGDDVYGEDPTINKLERKSADLLGKQEALFVPSGTMGNQIAINVHTSPGDEVVLDYNSHIVNYEMGAMAKISGVMPKTINTEKVFLPLKKVNNSIREEKYYLSDTSLIALENTHNAKGGKVYPQEKIIDLKNSIQSKDVSLHLDGARLLNAAIASNKNVKEITESFDSVMFCLSKGLGAPVGSMLVGDSTFVSRAREVRKSLGGGMRQAGILASAGIYALNNHIGRLRKDHRNAELLFKSLKEIEEIEIKEPETNIIIFDIKKEEFKPNRFIKELETNGVQISTIGDDKKLRAVTHLGITKKNIKEASKKIKKIINKNN